MLISVLKHIKLLQNVSVLTDHHQGVCLYLVKVTELFKILKNHYVKRTAPHGPPHILATRFAATTPGMIFKDFKFTF